MLRWRRPPDEIHDPTYERLLQAEQRHSAVLRSLLVDLTAKYHDLRRLGADAPSDQRTRGEVSDPIVRDPLVEAIRRKCGTNRELRSIMLSQLAVDRLTLSDAQILERIHDGESITGGDTDWRGEIDAE